jgi:holo-[acyl-carrier protein] synthase
MPTLRTGIDLIEIARMAKLKQEIRQRFLNRVFTDVELSLCKDSNQRLAGRFAAKEAVAKALGSGIGPISWHEIEIYQGPHGEPILNLTGQASKLAKELNLEQWSISISHTNEYAVAMAVAVNIGSNNR